MMLMPSYNQLAIHRLLTLQVIMIVAVGRMAMANEDTATCNFPADANELIESYPCIEYTSDGTKMLEAAAVMVLQLPAQDASNDKDTAEIEGIRQFLGLNKEALSLTYAALAKVPLSFAVEPAPYDGFQASFVLVARLLESDAILHAQEGRTEKAFQALKSLIYLCSAYPPTQSAQVQRFFIEKMFGSALGHVLARVEPTPSQLLGLRNLLSKEDFVELASKTVSVESSLQYIDLSKKYEQGGIDVLLEKGLRTPLNQLPLVSGISESHNLDNFESLKTDLICLSRQPRHERLSEMEQWEERFEKSVADWPLEIVADPLVNIYGRMSLEFLDECDSIHAYREVLITALAIKQYQVEKKRFPASVAELFPDYIAEMPRDIFDGDLIKYRKTDSGYVVYSVGGDGQDNAGESSDNFYSEGDISFSIN